MRLTATCLVLLAALVRADVLPPDAADLKAKRDTRLSEINRTYVAEMEKLQKKAMNEGNLEAANAIQQEILKATPDPFRNDAATAPPPGANHIEDPKLKPLIGVWKRDTDNGVWKITDTTGGTFNDRLRFTMSFDEKNNRVVVVGSHWADQLTFTSNPDVVNGSTVINGKTVRYKLKRVQ